MVLLQVFEKCLFRYSACCRSRGDFIFFVELCISSLQSADSLKSLCVLSVALGGELLVCHFGNLYSVGSFSPGIKHRLCLYGYCPFYCQEFSLVGCG